MTGEATTKRNRTSGTPGDGDPGSEYVRAATHLSAVLARAELWPALAADRASLSSGIDAMRRMQSDLNG